MSGKCGYVLIGMLLVHPWLEHFQFVDACSCSYTAAVFFFIYIYLVALIHSAQCTSPISYKYILTLCPFKVERCFHLPGAYLQVPWQILAVLCGVQATQVLTLTLCHVGHKRAGCQPWRMIPLRYCVIISASSLSYWFFRLLENNFSDIIHSARVKNSRRCTSTPPVCF